MWDSYRGQSETVGVVLLTAVFVVLATITGAFILSTFDGSDATEPTVDIESEIEGQNIRIEHRGGESYDPGEIVVILRGAGEDRWQLTRFDQVAGSANDSFSPGDRWEYGTVGFAAGDVELLIVDTDSNELLHEAAFRIEAGGLTVAGFDAPDTASAGERISVSAELVNDGDLNLTQEISLLVDGAVQNTTERTVAFDTSTSVTFSYRLADSRVEVLSVAIATDDDTETKTIPVRRDSDFFVDITGISSPVTVGDTITVDYEVENSGTARETQDIDFLIGGTVEDSESVTLDGGETYNGTFTYATNGDDTPSISVEAASDTDADSREIQILTRPAIDSVQITDDTGITNCQFIFCDYTVEYVVEYDISDPSSLLETVEGTFDNLNETGETVTVQEGDNLLGEITYTYTRDYVLFIDEPDTYQITIRIYDENGVITGEQVTVIDTADGTNP